MKKLLLTILAMAAVPAAFAQGSFNANNFTANQGEVWVDLDGSGTPTAGDALAGAEYNVQVYWGVIGTPEGSLTPVGPVSALFGSTGDALGSGAGWFDIGTLDLFPGNPTGPATVLVQVRGFQGPSWASATFRGQSAVVNQPIAFSPNTPGDLVATGPWVILIPEPSTFALAGLGSAALLIFRRRK